MQPNSRIIITIKSYLINVRINTVQRLCMMIPFLCLIVSTALLSQSENRPNIFNRYISGILSEQSELSKTQVIVYPVVAYAPETRTELGLTGLLLFFAKKDTTNRLSEMYVRGFYTFEKQYGLIIDHALYTDTNQWFFLGNARVQSFPLLFYGVGNQTLITDQQLVESFQIGAKERILYRMFSNLYAGLEFDINRTSAVRFSREENIADDPSIIGKDGFLNLGVGLGLVWDTRHNVLNVRSGSFSELAILYNHPSFGSDYNFGLINTDTRLFRKMGKNEVLAGQLFAQYAWGDVPFAQLPQLGGMMIGRGFYQGRFRDRGHWATQLEYRFLPLPLAFTQRIGAALFASTGQVFNQFSEIGKIELKHAVGGGLRFLLFPKKDIFVRMDYALTAEGGGFYFYIGEAF
jgi:hypothetical protein